MATTVKKKSSAKSPAKKKPALKKSKKVNPWLIGLGAVVVALVGAVVVRMSFAANPWPGRYELDTCGITTSTIQDHSFRTIPVPLREGSRGGCVKALQHGLVLGGFLNATVDGVYGPKTANAVLLAETYYGQKNPDKVATRCIWYFLDRGNAYGYSNKAAVKNNLTRYPATRGCYY